MKKIEMIKILATFTVLSEKGTLYEYYKDKTNEEKKHGINKQIKGLFKGCGPCKAITKPEAQKLYNSVCNEIGENPEIKLQMLINEIQK